MAFWNWLIGWWRRRKPAPRTSEPLGTRLSCPHGRGEHFDALVRGSRVRLTSSPLCPGCTESYLDQYATICAVCFEPILVGEPVGVAWDGAPYPYVHLTFTCADSGGQFCGHWGEGKLVPFDFS